MNERPHIRIIPLDDGTYLINRMGVEEELYGFTVQHASSAATVESVLTQVRDFLKETP